jgi:hypothetical protein
MAFATPANTNGADFIDAIRSIAIEQMEGENIEKRARHLANISGVGMPTLMMQVTEMVDILAN